MGVASCDRDFGVSCPRGFVNVGRVKGGLQKLYVCGTCAWLLDLEQAFSISVPLRLSARPWTDGVGDVSWTL